VCEGKSVRERERKCVCERDRLIETAGREGGGVREKEKERGKERKRESEREREREIARERECV